MASKPENARRSRGPRSAPGNTTQAANPKTATADSGSNRIKDPDDWVTGREPMTGAQASYLKTLSEEAHEPDAYEPDLEKAEASKRIDHLKRESGR